MKKWIVFAAACATLAGCGVDEEDAANSNETTQEATEESQGERGTIDGEERSVNHEHLARAETLIGRMDEEEFEAAREHFDEPMQTQLTAEALETMWQALESDVGAFISYEYREAQVEGDYSILLFDGTFAATDLTIVLSFNQADEVAGLFFQ